VVLYNPICFSAETKVAADNPGRRVQLTRSTVPAFRVVGIQYSHADNREGSWVAYTSLRDPGFDKIDGSRHVRLLYFYPVMCGRLTIHWFSLIVVFERILAFSLILILEMALGGS
jgi:hypothetical protein